MNGPHPTPEDVPLDLPPAEEPTQPSSPDDEQAHRGRLRARGEAQLDKAREWLEQRRSTSYPIDTALLFIERNRVLPAPVLVGALASRLVIYVIPFMVLMVFAIGVYADLASRSPAEAARDAGMAGLFAQAAEDTTRSGDGFRFAALLATSFAVLWAADGVAKMLRRSYSLVWGIPLSRPRYRWALPLMAIFVSIGALVIANIALDSQDWPLTITAGEVLLEIAVVALLWILISRALPHHPAAHHWWDFLPGALIVAVGVVAMRVAMVVYFAPRSETLSERYGSVATAVVLLTWAYWVGFIVVASADLNVAIFRSIRRRRGVEPMGSVTPTE